MEQIPEGHGYGQFTSLHFLWIVITVVFVAVVSVVYGNCDAAGRLIVLRTIGATLIIIDVIKMIVIGISEVKITEYLPLELCSFAAYTIVCDSINPMNDIFPLPLLTLFMPAAIMAVLFPTTSTLPFVNFHSIHLVLYHGLIIAYVIARFAAGEIALSYIGLWKGVGCVFILASVMFMIDTVFNRNFMFLRGTENNPLLEVIWKKTHGGLAYTGGLFCFCIVVIHIFYVIFKIAEMLFLR